MVNYVIILEMGRCYSFIWEKYVGLFKGKVVFSLNLVRE